MNFHRRQGNKTRERSALGSFFDSDVDFLQLDDEDIADLVVDHLQDSSSWLTRRLIGDANFAHDLLRYTEALCEGRSKNSTDLSWGCEHGRLFPLRLAGSQLEARGREDFTWTFSGRRSDSSTADP